MTGPTDGLTTRRCEPRYLSKAAPRPPAGNSIAHPSFLRKNVIPYLIRDRNPQAENRPRKQRAEGATNNSKYPEDNLEREILSNE